MSTTNKLSVHANPAENAFEESRFWKLKVWLQFTGWLLYLANTIGVLVLLGFSWLATASKAPSWVVTVLLAGGLLLGVSLMFDLVTVRFGVRPNEPRPTSSVAVDPFDVIRERVSCRSFQPVNMSDDHRGDLLASIEEHSRAGAQIGSGVIRFEYVAASLNVWPVVGAQEFLVAVASVDYSRLSVIDVGRSLQKVVNRAVARGLATCWIGPGANQISIVGQLGDRFDAERDHVICVVAVGYASRFKPLALRGMQRSQRRRLALEELFFSDPLFSQALDPDAQPYEQFGRTYEVCQWSPSSYNGQTTRASVIAKDLGGRSTVVRTDFASTTQSKYYAAVALGIWCANWEAGCELLGLKGHFEVLSDDARGVENTPPLPRYDISWIAD